MDMPSPTLRKKREDPHENQEIPSPEVGRTPALKRVQELSLETNSYLQTMPGWANLRELDKTVLIEGLRMDRLLDSWKEARYIETTSKPRSQLAATGTLGRYREEVRRLREADTRGDAYSRFAMLTKGDEVSADTLYRQKAALNREASRSLLLDGPRFLRAVAAQSRTTETATETIDEWVSESFADGFYDTNQPILTMDELLELARASRFLEEFPPDPNGIRTREAWANGHLPDRLGAPAPAPQSDIEAAMAAEEPTPKKRRDPRSKKGTVTKLNRFAKRRGPDYDWRGEIWKQIEAAPQLAVERKALIATAMITGCRPADMLKGIDVYRLKPSPTDDHYRLLVRITGSKISDADHLDGDMEDSEYRLSPAEKLERAELRADESVQHYLEKGQEYRWLELECRTPEALWLAQHVASEGTESALEVRSEDEAEEVSGYGREAFPSLHLTLTSAFRDQAKAAAMPTAERDRRAVNKLGRALDRYSKKAMPTFRDNVTIYCLRHAFAQDNKVRAKDEYHVSSAAALGHRAATTQHRYGGQKAPSVHKSRGAQIRKMITPRPVRERKSQPEQRFNP